MKLPNGNAATVDSVKLRSYLLSLTHPAGKSKARFFRRVGFSQSNIGLLAQCLLDVARTAEVTVATRTAYGMKYVVDGLLPTPSGDQVSLRTIWIVEREDARPRFVTAYPM